MDLENKRVNTLEACQPEKRYFGKDITNTEHNLFQGRDAAKARPEFKSIELDKKRHAGPKPSPTNFLRNLADRQKKPHRRLATNELERSGANERREPRSRSKGRADPEQAEHLQRQDAVKQNLSRLLQVRHRAGPAGEGSQDRLGSGREAPRPLEGRKPSTVRDPPQQPRLGSLAHVGPAKASSAASRQPPPLLPAQPRPMANCPGAEKPSRKLLNNKFQNLRLQLEEQRREEEAVRDERGAAFENELETGQAGPEEPHRLRRQFDLAFIWEFLLARDVGRPLTQLNMCGAAYFERHQSLNDSMRKILVDWLIDVHRKFKLRHETLFMAVNIIDRFLGQTSESIPKGKFQLFGVSCLFIASKYEEIYPPALSDFVYVCADTYSGEQILEMEGLILNQLGFSLVYSSSLQLLGIYSCESKPRSPEPLEDRDRHLVLYLLFLCLVNYKVVAAPDRLKLAAAVFLSRKILQKPAAAEEISREFQLPVETIKAVALELFVFIGTEENEERLTAVRRLFNHSQFGYISTIKLSLKNS